MEIKRIISILDFLNEIEETKGKKVKTYSFDEETEKLKIEFKDGTRTSKKFKKIIKESDLDEK